jgi:hypothetical protein
MLRNAGRLPFSTWRGLNTFTPPEGTDPQTWIDSNNVLVNARGAAEVLRSPKRFGSVIPEVQDASSDSSSSDSSSDSSASSEDDSLIDLSEYARLSGHALIIDKGDDTLYLLAAGGAPTGIRSGQAGVPWTSLTINDRYQRVDGNEFIQFLNDFSYVRNGIDAPTIAPTISYVADDPSDSISDDAGVIAVSIQGSYAYHNSTTNHTGPPSPLSNVLGPTTTNNTLRFAVTASSQPGVDKIVFFITVDGGDIPYLMIDCGDASVIKEPNATTSYDFPISALARDTLTPEPIYNQPPPTDFSFIFEHKNRIIGIKGAGIRYSGFESVYIGNNYESWPILNQSNVPNTQDKPRSGISTQIGALIFGGEDSYMLSGSPSDKTSSPQNTIAITEKLTPMNWRLGVSEETKRTAVTTPYGVIWTDQTRRIRNWNMTGFPIEIAQALREELDGMTGSLRAKWFQHGKHGGYYIVGNDTKTLMVMLYLSAETGQLQFGYGRTNIPMDAFTNITFATERFFFGKDNQVYEILNPDLQGDGWAPGTQIYFKTMIGNEGNFSYLHSLSLSGGLKGLVVTVAKPDGTDLVQLDLESDLDTGGDSYSVVDQYGRRHLTHFKFDLTDGEKRYIDGFQLFMTNKQRVI